MDVVLAIRCDCAIPVSRNDMHMHTIINCLTVYYNVYILTEYNKYISL